MDDILKGQIGSEGSYDVDLKDGKVILTITYKGQQAGASVSGEIGLDLLLDKVAEKFQNDVVKQIVAVLKVAVKVI